MKRLNRAVEITRSRGLRALGRAAVGAAVRRIRPHTPWLNVTYNDVTVRRHRWVDRLVPWFETAPRPAYEGTIVSATHEHVSPGETVVLLGGGTGVTTVHAARSAGTGGEVHVYEASQEMLRVHERTLELNPVDAHVELIHGIVGRSGEIWGEAGETTQISPEELPVPDTIIIDIEGAEADVVPHLPDIKTILVETHGTYGSPTSEMINHLRERGYRVDVAGVAEPSMARQHEREDVKVVVATNPHGPTTHQRR